MLTAPVFQLWRPALLVYSGLALALSSALLLLSLRRGAGEFALWLIAFLAVGLVSWRRPRVSLLVAGAMALLLGFVRTYRGGYNLDLGLSLIALSAGLYVLGRARGTERSFPVDLAGLSLFLLAGWSVVSLVFSLARIHSFVAAPGFAFHWYPFNRFRLYSQEAMVQGIIGATGVFVWFGLYVYACAAKLDRKVLNVTVFGLLLGNAAVLLVQRFLDPTFLHPVGFPQVGRLNGVTSFCYALGDVVLSLFLLLPVWGAARGLMGVLTAGSLALLAYALVGSGSRTALFTMLLAAGLWACVRLVRLLRARRGFAASLLLATVVLLPFLTLAAYWVTPPDQATPLGRLKWGVEREGLVRHVFAPRLSSYPLIFRVIGEYPLSGVGAGLYPAEVSKQHALLTPDLEILDPYLLNSFAPNGFLNTGVELGLPAMLALVLVFLHAAAKAVPRRGSRGSADLAVSLLALAVALQFGPSFNNSEALVFFWLVIGLAARSAGDPGAPAAPAAGPRTVGPRATTGLVAGAVVLGVTGQLLSLPSLAVEQQWKRLRWPLSMGMRPREPGGRWTAPEATFVVRTNAPEVLVRWHAGDPGAHDYRAVVAFYVDGALVERLPAHPGRIRESVLPLPAITGLKRISVLVSPPFVPADAVGGEDRRRLGIFIHSVTPVGSSSSEVRAP